MSSQQFPQGPLPGHSAPSTGPDFLTPDAGPGSGPDFQAPLAGQPGSPYGALPGTGQQVPSYGPLIAGPGVQSAGAPPQPPPGPQPQAPDGSQPGPGKPKKKASTGLLIGIGVLVLAVIGTTIGVLVLYRTPEQRAADAVKDFMKAYAAGNTTKVKAYLELDPGADQSLITDDALPAAVKKAPITDVTYLGSGFKYMAKFNVGGRSDSLELVATVPDSSSARVTLKTELPTLDLREYAGLPVTLNGAKPASAQPLVLPGGYTVGFDNPNFTVDPAKATFIAHSGRSHFTPAPRLSEAGETAARAKIKESVTACLAETTLAWTCGKAVTIQEPGLVLTEGTVKRTSTPEEMAKIDKFPLTLDKDKPNLVSPGGMLPQVTTTLGCTKNGVATTCKAHAPLKFPTIDMLTPDLKITWPS